MSNAASPSDPPPARSFVQRLVLACVPRAWGASIEADSRRWTLRCECGHERSVWAAGGVRWLAKGSPKRLLPCPACGRTTWHSTTWRDEPVD